MIVLDTHVWIWFVSDPSMLSYKAGKAITSAQENNEILISSISVWEVALLVRKNRLVLTMDVADWVAKSENLPFLSFVPVDNTIALKSIHLPEPIHEDPADRLIISTAISTGSYLISRDRKIREYKPVKTIW